MGSIKFLLVVLSMTFSFAQAQVKKSGGWGHEGSVDNMHAQLILQAATTSYNENNDNCGEATQIAIKATFEEIGNSNTKSEWNEALTNLSADPVYVNCILSVLP